MIVLNCGQKPLAVWGEEDKDMVTRSVEQQVLQMWWSQ